jgi:hypothetical protein
MPHTAQGILVQKAMNVSDSKIVIIIADLVAVDAQSGLGITFERWQEISNHDRRFD